jgi:hypothetical protein
MMVALSPIPTVEKISINPIKARVLKNKKNKINYPYAYTSYIAFFVYSLFDLSRMPMQILLLLQHNIECNCSHLLE